MPSSDASLLVCVVALATAIGAYGVASLLQAMAARRHPDGSLARLLLQPLVLGGLGLDVVGFVGTAVALHALPLFFVQGAASASILITSLLASVFLRERPSRREAAMMPVVLIGLVALAASAEPGPAGALPLTLLAGLALTIPLVAAGGWCLVTRAPSWAGAGLAVLAGLSYGAAGLTARGLSAAGSPHSWLVPTLLVVTLHALQGVVLVTASMRQAAVNSVTSVLFATETLMPSAVGLALLGDRATAGMGWYALAGAALLLLSSAALSRGPAHGHSAPSPAQPPAASIPAQRTSPEPNSAAHRAGRHRRAAVH